MRRPLRTQKLRTIFVAVSILALFATRSHADESAVQIAEQQRIIPTYEVGPAEPNPMFYDHESYQGAQKRVYPYALQDNLLHTKKDRSYTSLELENQYVKIAVLPQIGGRLFSAIDKTDGYDFFYHQHVIKPALIGMLGAWISGGIEWCAFHHHRNTTFMPVDYTLMDNRDGSKTIWFGEIERRQRMKWLIGLTLFPDKSYVQAEVKLFNRTAQPHSILYWANVAVHVNDQYQVYFPPSVQVATYHSKIDFTTWPIARGMYRGHDYSNVDISWWKNSPVSNSFFAWDLREDFMGGYDHGKNAGVVHVADHNVVCGAKLWEWGTGPAGRAWDKILTDNDGPYAELMVGAFSNNQPDYSWIKPHEVKTFKQYWYPISGIGGIKNANLNGAVNLELGSGHTAKFGFCPTARRSGTTVVLKNTKTDKTLSSKTVDTQPGKPIVATVHVPANVRETDLSLTVIADDGTELIRYAPIHYPAVKDLPKPVQPPPKPADIKSIEELYITGLRIEQIHNPSVDPLQYYQEALRRDPSDSRCNIMLGIHANKNGDFQSAEQFLRKAIERISEAYTRPKDTQAYYQLGIALRGQHKTDAAHDAFYRAAWDDAYRAAAHYQRAELATAQSRFQLALEHITNVLAADRLDTRALSLKAAILRKMQRYVEAERAAQAALSVDPLDFHAANELVLTLQGRHKSAEAEKELQRLTKRMRGNVQSYLELASDYMDAGLWDAAIAVLRRPGASDPPSTDSPLLHYYLGYALLQNGSKDAAKIEFARGAKLPIKYCFPFRLEGLDVLHAAIGLNPNDAHAYYYLGNLMFDRQPDVAIASWEKSRAIDATLATVHRNLGWAYQHTRNDAAKAILCYEQALACDQNDPRLFLEIDQLYEYANIPPARRLAAMKASHETLVQRQDSFMREIRVLVLNGVYDQAIDYLEHNYFHAQEGRRDVHDLFVDAHLLKGLDLLKHAQPDEALKHFHRAAEYPENLSVGRPANDPQAAQIAYYLGLAYDTLKQETKARESYQQAAEMTGLGGNPVAQFCQAMSLKQLGQSAACEKALAALIQAGKKGLAQEESSDFFAKFGTGRSRRVQVAAAHLMLGLGLLGQGDQDAAHEEFAQAAAGNYSDVWAAYFAANGGKGE